MNMIERTLAALSAEAKAMLRAYSSEPGEPMPKGHSPEARDELIVHECITPFLRVLTTRGMDVRAALVDAALDAIDPPDTKLRDEALADVASLRAALSPRGRAGDLGLRLDRIEAYIRRAAS